MAILSMTNLASQRAVESTRSDVELVTDTDKAREGAVSTLAAFVPAPVIALWALALGLIRPESDLLRWSMFGAAMIILIGVVVLDAMLSDKKVADQYRKASKPNPPLLSSKQKRWMVTLAVVAFALWALATPGSPAEGIGENATRWFAIAAAVGAIFIPRIAKLNDLVPLSGESAENQSSSGDGTTK